eukprot:TRINITY_DN8988_c0_g1_i1.p1 TRINITY_DN8988_c0_g1~~TRINITY_DN8988_c0_g1_i1.p1  ORF type:complete len:669 (-),score=159.62 TRINITY_DN8988_c0_g1_i1:9-1982(-)
MEGGRQGSSTLNLSVADRQITAEQIMLEAFDLQAEAPKPPKQSIQSMEELEDYRLQKRTEFEATVRQKRHTIGIWLRYAKWEEQQKDLVRARSVYERAREIDYTNPILWLRYAEMEIRNKNINHARNVWDRAISLLPREDQLWYKYVLMEDMLGQYSNVRKIYERWMDWEPDENAWNAYITFEKRNGEIDRVRHIFARYVVCHPKPKVWLRWAKFEESQGEIGNARKVFEDTLDILESEDVHTRLYIDFAKFEEGQKEFDRVREIYRYALDKTPPKKAKSLINNFIRFEKQHGNKDTILEIIVAKRRFQYEEDVELDPTNYDVWFDYIRLEESVGDIERIREVYERSIANLPPSPEKRLWKRYIYLWINYALYEEMETKDYNRAREVYNTIMKIIPHKKFSFSKLWLMFSNFELRRQDITAARKILGYAIGVNPNEKIFDGYIELELKMGNIDRARILYSKYLDWAPENCQAWCKFAEMETALNEIERARAIYELAIQQPLLDMPELIWKGYIEFEIEGGDYDRARELYKVLLQRTTHVRVWISYAQFETSIGQLQTARNIYTTAFDKLKDPERVEERVLLIEQWRDFEEEAGDEITLQKVQDNLPKRVKKRRKVYTEEGEEAGFEEYFDYLFPDQVKSHPSKLLFESAKNWKANKQ